jgi:multidrug efflux pump subunit AcrA (membrane-fusion protein)
VSRDRVTGEDDVHFEYVILLEQQTAAEARAAAAQARADAQVEAQRVRDQAQQIREQAQQIREQVAQQIRIEQGQRPGPGEGVIVLPPGAPPWQQNQIPPQIVDIFTMLVIATVICIVGLPVARALGRWIDRRGVVTPVNLELAAQMTRIEQAVDTMSVEVERISEAQRFQAKLLSDREKVRA